MEGQLDDDTQLLSPLELQALSTPPEDNVGLVSPRANNNSDTSSYYGDMTPRTRESPPNQKKHSKKDAKKNSRKALPVKLIAIIKKSDDSEQYDDSPGGSVARYKKRFAHTLNPSDYKKTMVLLGDDWEDSYSEEEDTTYGSGDDGTANYSKEYWLDPTWVIDENEQELIEQWEKRKRKKEERARKKKNKAETGETSLSDMSTDSMLLTPRKPKRNASSPKKIPTSPEGRRSSVIILSPVSMNKRRASGKSRGSLAFYEELTLGQHILRNATNKRTTPSSSPRRNPLTFATTVRLTETARDASSAASSSDRVSSNELLTLPTEKLKEKQEYDGTKTDGGSDILLQHDLEDFDSPRDKQSLQQLKELQEDKATWARERQEWAAERVALREENDRLRHKVQQLKHKRKQHKQQIKQLQKQQQQQQPQSPTYESLCLESPQPVKLKKRSLLLPHPPNGPASPLSSPPRALTIGSTSNSSVRSKSTTNSPRRSTPTLPPKPAHTEAPHDDDTDEDSPAAVIRRSGMSLNARKRMLNNLQRIQIPPQPESSSPEPPPYPPPQRKRSNSGNNNSGSSNSSKQDGQVKVVTPRRRPWGSYILPDRAERNNNSSSNSNSGDKSSDKGVPGVIGGGSGTGIVRSASTSVGIIRGSAGSNTIVDSPDNNNNSSGGGGGGGVSSHSNKGFLKRGGSNERTSSSRFLEKQKKKKSPEKDRGEMDFSISASAIPMRTRAATSGSSNESSPAMTPRQQQQQQQQQLPQQQPHVPQQQGNRKIKRGGSDILGFCLHKK